MFFQITWRRQRRIKGPIGPLVLEACATKTSEEPWRWIWVTKHPDRSIAQPQRHSSLLCPCNKINHIFFLVRQLTFHKYHIQ
jgi:hypothetical protein